MLYVHKCPESGRVFICRKGQDNNLAEVFPHNGLSAENVAWGLIESRKSTILITVSGGVAEFKVFSQDANIEVELIDFDNLDNPKDIKDIIAGVRGIPARTKGEKAYKKNALSALKDKLKQGE